MVHSTGHSIPAALAAVSEGLVSEGPVFLVQYYNKLYNYICLDS